MHQFILLYKLKETILDNSTVPFHVSRYFCYGSFLHIFIKNNVFSSFKLNNGCVRKVPVRPVEPGPMS